MALDKFTWENGSQVEPAKVEVEGVSYDVVDAQYEGSTPVSAGNLNAMQDILNNNIENEVVKGNDTSNNYIKLIDGTLICYYTKPISTVVNTSWGGTKRSGPVNMDDYAMEFKSIPTVLITITGSQGGWTMPVTPGGSTTNPGQQYIVRGEGSSSTLTFDVNVLAIGRWK